MGKLLLGILVTTVLAGPARADDTCGGTTYEQAQAALLAGDYNHAIALAQKAILQRDADATAARMLYADALARSGQLKRAKAFYAGLHKTAPASARAEIEKRLAAINRSLRLAADHGLHAPAPTAQVDAAALYAQARTALDAHDHKRALELAKQSATHGGPQEAKLVYADALFATGEYTRAKAFYVGLHRRWTGALKTTVENRIAATNGKLALDARDGL